MSTMVQLSLKYRNKEVRMISLIAVVGKNNELGKNNDLIWHLPNDLKFFK